MPFVFCVDVPVSVVYPRGQHCFPVPSLEEYPKLIPPEPPEETEFRDWRILATIDELARTLSRDRGADIIQSVAARFEEAGRYLGEGASLSGQLHESADG